MSATLLFFGWCVTLMGVVFSRFRNILMHRQIMVGVATDRGMVMAFMRINRGVLVGVATSRGVIKVFTMINRRVLVGVVIMGGVATILTSSSCM